MNSGLVHRIYVLLVLLGFGLCDSPSEISAQNDAKSTTGLAQKLDELFEAEKFNGTVLIAIDGETVFEKSVGFANPSDETPLSDRSSFRLASVSKQFTAMCIMMLAEEGKLDYDDDIQKYLPELPYEGITIRHLLHHTGGLPDYMMLFGKHWETDKNANERSMAFNRDTVALFADHKPSIEFAPGDNWAYSNTGYVLLGRIVSVASGLPIRQFLQERIFDPLEMEDAHAFDVEEKFRPYERVYGFSFKRRGGYRDNDHHYLNGMLGDGGVYCSARDLLKWDQALYTEKLVKRSTLDEAFTPAVLNNGKTTDYGFGWIIEERPGGSKQVSHGGGWVGFRTFIARDIESRTLVIVLSNNTTSELRTVIEEAAKLTRDD